MIVIVNFGMGNLFSIQSAFHYLGAECIISSDHETIAHAGKLILPGVGSFKKAMENLRESGLFEVITQAVLNDNIPILGICLGMQLLGISSTEDGFSEGFGFVDAPVERFNENHCSNLKIPHVGFSTVTVTGENILFQNLKPEIDFYFTHSYRMAFTGQNWCAGSCLHGEPFIAAFQKDHICGTQFHPEKSQTNGLILLRNFAERF